MSQCSAREPSAALKMNCWTVAGEMSSVSAITLKGVLYFTSRHIFFTSSSCRSSSSARTWFVSFRLGLFIFEVLWKCVHWRVPAEAFSASLSFFCSSFRCCLCSCAVSLWCGLFALPSSSSSFFAPFPWALGSGNLLPRLSMHGEHRIWTQYTVFSGNFSSCGRCTQRWMPTKSTAATGALLGLLLSVGSIDFATKALSSSGRQVTSNWSLVLTVFMCSISCCASFSLKFGKKPALFLPCLPPSASTSPLSMALCRSSCSRSVMPPHMTSISSSLVWATSLVSLWWAVSSSPGSASRPSTFRHRCWLSASGSPFLSCIRNENSCSNGSSTRKYRSSVHSTPSWTLPMVDVRWAEQPRCTSM
mmetsp:Transcript_65102/g.174070  ORF Transcript_65102/g.174070 Transcript_65102/m.174070 type:complete len:361 (-) Transcript_65102:356-1438(-)